MDNDLYDFKVSKEFNEIKDEILKQKGIAFFSEVVDEFIKRHPEYSNDEMIRFSID